MKFTKTSVYETLKYERGKILNDEFTMQTYHNGYDISLNKFGLLRGIMVDTDNQEITIHYITPQNEDQTETVGSIPELLTSLQSYNHEIS